MSCTSVSSGSRPRPLRLRVLTYNIRHGEGLDGRIDLDRQAAVIRSCDPDLVALQEVDNRTRRTQNVDQTAELERLTRLQAHFGPAMDFDGGQYGLAVLSRHPLPCSTVWALPYSSSREPRVGLAVRVRLPAGAGELLFVCTHLDYGPGSPDRLPQAEELERLATATVGQSPAVLAGDLNSAVSGAPVRALARRWRLSCGQEAAPTYPADAPQECIDHVLFRPADRWRVLACQVLAEPVASDHRPVLVELELRPGPVVWPG